MYDPFRKSVVVATPEEKVRQLLLQNMTAKWGFPKELLSVELELSQLPHLKGAAGLPKRRVDIVCFAKNIHSKFPLYPLLLIECKKGNEDANEQVLGYNHFVQAPYVAVARENGVELIHPQTLPFLPTYSQLLQQVCL